MNDDNLDQSNLDENNLLKYYVYELVDSSTDEVIYVGKGTGNRPQDHLYEAEKNISENEKVTRIRDIQKNGAEVIVRVIGRYKTEDEAFAVESTMMHWVYDFNDLTNIQQGRGSVYIRPNGDNSEIKGIDIDDTREPGDYSLDNIGKLKKADAFGFITDLRNSLSKDFSVNDHPLGERNLSTNGYLGFTVNMTGITFIVVTRATKKLTVKVKQYDETKENFLEELGLELDPLINGGQYHNIKNVNKINTKDELTSFFTNINEKIQRIS